MDRLFAHSLVVVMGKGGVGKSTVAAALGLAATRRGLRTIVVEVAARGDVWRALGASHQAGAHVQRSLSGGLHHISIDPHHALEDYLRRQPVVAPIAGRLSHSRIFTTLTAATPGMSELLTIGKVWELARGASGARAGAAVAPRTGPDSYDLVVLDAPATGHGLAMLRAPSTFASVARVGPVAGQGRAIADFLSDPRRTAVVAVCTPEEMPVSETLELRTELRQQPGLDLAVIVVNAVVGHRFSERDRRALRAAPPSPARHAALFSATWARHQRAQIRRLRQAAAGVASVTLPFVFGSALDRAALQRLSSELDR